MELNDTLMRKELREKSMWSNTVIDKFTDKYYSGIITEDNIPNTKRMIKYKIVQDGEETEVNVKGWTISVSGYSQKVLIPDEFNIGGEIVKTLDILPIKISKEDNSTEEITSDKEVFLKVNNIESFTITPENLMSIREITDIFSTRKHSNPAELKLMTNIFVTSYLKRMNWRMSAIAGFGKDSVLSSMESLMPDIINYQAKTASKIKVECDNKSLLVSNEFMEVSRSNKYELQDYYRDAGDNKSVLKNNSNKSVAHKTKDRYNTEKLSTGIIYNLMDYYVGEEKVNDKTSEWFDNIYPYATRERYLPVLFEKGKLDSGQFEVTEPESEELFNHYENTFLSIVKSLLWHQKHFDESLKDKNWVWDKYKPIGSEDNRLNTHFNRLVEGLKAYSQTEQEFNKRCDNARNHFNKYLGHISRTRIEKLREVLTDVGQEYYLYELQKNPSFSYKITDQDAEEIKERFLLTK